MRLPVCRSRHGRRGWDSNPRNGLSRSGAFKAPALVHYATSPGSFGPREQVILSDRQSRYGTLSSVMAITVTAPGGPEVLRWRSVPDPEPGVGEVLVDVAAAGVNRADLLQRRGHYAPPAGASELLGLECSGVVAAVGDGVDGGESVDRVSPCWPAAGTRPGWRFPRGNWFPCRTGSTWSPRPA